MAVLLLMVAIVIALTSRPRRRRMRLVYVRRLPAELLARPPLSLAGYKIVETAHVAA